MTLVWSPRFFIMITQYRLKELLDYNPETWIFIWKRTNAIAGHADKINGYVVIWIDKKKYRAHRLVWLYMYWKFPEQLIDHINGIKTDNRLVNLRDISNRDNLQNKARYRRGNSDLPTWVQIIRYKGEISSYKADWNDNGKVIHWPAFNIKKCWGKENAIALAFEYRKNKIAELNAQGAKYTDRHGL